MCFVGLGLLLTMMVGLNSYFVLAMKKNKGAHDAQNQINDAVQQQVRLLTDAITAESKRVDAIFKSANLQNEFNKIIANALKLQNLTDPRLQTLKQEKTV